MTWDLKSYFVEHPRLLKGVIVLKRARTKVAVAVVAACLARSAFMGMRPLDMDEFDGSVAAALALVAIGVLFRFAAHGCLRKQQVLATGGVYSLCRHPLYFGSVLITCGFCVLMRRPEYFIVAGVYFLLFYPLTMLWEDVRLGERYGEAYERYRQGTPLFLPLGRFAACEFSWMRALRGGGAVLVTMTAVLLVAVECMAEAME